MPDNFHKPVVFLAFANDRSGNGAGYLRNLPEEARRLSDVLGKAQEASLCEVVVEQNATLDEILDRFQHTKYRNHIAVFHYAGHANGYQLLLESANGQPAAAHAGGLAAFLGQQRGLHLVFLNGCSTQAQVQGLLDAGVSAVIATAQAIDDAVAASFATRFYIALAGGAAIRTAFVEAEAAIKTARGNQTRHLYAQDTQVEIANRWPWELYLRTGAEAVAEWDLPRAVGDLLFGLPSPPPRDLPASPYRYLDWYRQEDAELFFGRGRAIRDLYTRATAADSQSILLFYGQSGVGKSSLLAAGLLPRLEASHIVVYLRRNQARGLLGTLTAPPSPLHADPPGLGWTEIEQQTGKPLLVILDQVEELFTRPNPDLPDEMDQLLANLQEVFHDLSLRPQGRLILSFRKEWLAEIRTLFREVRLAFGEVFLERLDRAGIIEVVTGPARVARLQQHYDLSVEETLPGLIADTLLADAGSAIAPTLQILLTRMWQAAKQDNHVQPHFGRPLYDRLRQEGLGLDDFLSQQLAALGHTQAAALESGLALDLLAFHTTPLGTAEERTQAQVRSSYPQQPVDELVFQLQQLYLLTDPAHNQLDREPASRLAHDTLAPLVRHRFEESDLPGQRARRALESRAVEWQDGETGTPLDLTDLALVEVGAQGMRAWSDDEIRLVEASRAARQRRAVQERNRRRAMMLVISLFLIAGAVALWFGQASQAANEREQLAREAQATEAALRGDEARARQTAEANERLAATREADARVAEATAVVAQATAVAAQAETEALKDVIEANRLVAEADIAGTDQLPQRRLLLALEAANIHAPNANPLPVAHMALRSALSTNAGIGLNGHEDAVIALAFSPDGKWLATGGADRTARLWDLQDPSANSRLLPGNLYIVSYLAFSPDSRWLATSSGESVLLWSTEDPSAEPTVLGYDDSISHPTFSPDGSWLVTSSRQSVLLWNMRDRSAEPIELVGHADIWNLTISPDGTWLAVSTLDGIEPAVLLWNLQNIPSDYVPLRGHEGTIWTLAFSPNSRWLATESYDATLRLWDMQDHSAESIVLSRGDSVSDPTFSPDGRWLAASSGQSVLLWDMQERSAKPLAFSHDGTALNATFSPDGRWLATSSGQSVLLWDMQDHGAEPLLLSGHDATISALAFSPSGRWLASAAADYTARLWDLHDRSAEPIVLNGHEGMIDDLSYASNGTWLATGSADKTVRLWEAQDLSTEPVVLSGHEDFISALDFSPDGAWLATSSGDTTVRLWDMQDRSAEPIILADHDTFISSLDFSPDGLWLAAGGEDPAVRLWDMQNPGAAPIMLSGHEGRLYTLVFSPDGRWLATGSADATARLWDMQDYSAEPLVLHGSAVSSLAFSPDGAWLATNGGPDMGAHLWNLRERGADPIVLSGHQDTIMDMSFSQDGKWLATAGRDRTVRLWDMSDPTISPLVLTGHEDRIYALDFSQDGAWLATGGADNTARLWDMQNPTGSEPIVLGGHTDDVIDLTFSPDGRWLVTGGRDNAVRLWRVQLTDLVALACRAVGRNLSQNELRFYFPNEPDTHLQTCTNLPPHPSVTAAISS